MGGHRVCDDLHRELTTPDRAAALAAHERSFQSCFQPALAGCQRAGRDDLRTRPAPASFRIDLLPAPAGSRPGPARRCRPRARRARRAARPPRRRAPPRGSGAPRPRAPAPRPAGARRARVRVKGQVQGMPEPGTCWCAAAEPAAASAQVRGSVEGLLLGLSSVLHTSKSMSRDPPAAQQTHAELPVATTTWCASVLATQTGATVT